MGSSISGGICQLTGSMVNKHRGPTEEHCDANRGAHIGSWCLFKSPERKLGTSCLTMQPSTVPGLKHLQTPFPTQITFYLKLLTKIPQTPRKGDVPTEERKALKNLELKTKN